MVLEMRICARGGAAFDRDHIEVVHIDIEEGTEWLTGGSEGQACHVKSIAPVLFLESVSFDVVRIICFEKYPNGKAMLLHTRPTGGVFGRMVPLLFDILKRFLLEITSLLEILYIGGPKHVSWRMYGDIEHCSVRTELPVTEED